MTSTDTPQLSQVTVGQRVRFTQPLDRFPHFAIEVGEEGTIEYADSDSICVKMDRHIPEAAEWDNQVVFAAEDAEFLDGGRPLAQERDTIETVAEQASDAFWAVVAKAYPQVTTGDFGPEETFKWTGACEDAIRTWLTWNDPTHYPSVALRYYTEEI